MFYNVSKSFLLLAITLTVACNSPEQPKQEDVTTGLEASVYISAGELYPKFSNLEVPTFFNLAKIESSDNRDINSIVLGKKKSKGLKLSVHPVALLSFNQDTILHKYVVSIDSSNKRIESDYNSFLLNNYNMQTSIENWFKSQCFPQPCTSFNWENSFKALLELNNQTY